MQSVQFSCSVVSDSVTPWTAAGLASLSIANSQSLLKLMSIKSVTPASHLILYCPLLLLSSIFPSVRVFPMSQFWKSKSDLNESFMEDLVSTWLMGTVDTNRCSQGMSKPPLKEKCPTSRRKVLSFSHSSDTFWNLRCLMSERHVHEQDRSDPCSLEADIPFGEDKQ